MVQRCCLASTNLALQPLAFNTLTCARETMENESVLELAHHDAPISNRNTFGPELLVLALFAAGNQSAIGRHYPPPRDLASIAAQRRTHRPGCSWLADFGRDFAVGHDLAAFQGADHVEHVGLERCEFCVGH